jgi:hypothetical protein
MHPRGGRCSPGSPCSTESRRRGRARRGRGALGRAIERITRRAYVYDLVPRRDERFQDLYNQGVNAEAFLYNEAFPDRAKALMMLYKRLREIDVPEMMASIIVETKDKPWGYYLDMSRQLWDEARHAMMGEVGFVSRGSTGPWRGSRTTGRCGSTPSARRSSGTRCSTSSSRA